MKNCLVIICFFLLPACVGSFSGGLGSFHPAFMAVDQPGPPEYQAGWKDGCQSGLATYGSFWNKMDASFYQNASMLHDAKYMAGWHESFDYCRHYNYKWYTQDN